MLLNRCSDRSVSHVFICEGWQAYNDMVPFFRSSEKTHDALLFTDVAPEGFSPHIRPLQELLSFPLQTNCAVVYLTFPRHYGEYVHSGTLSACRVKTVRLYHGIAGPWAKFASSRHSFIDAVVAASDLDAKVLRTMTPYRVETIGWPKGESFLKARSVPARAEKRSVVISSSWTGEKADFRICDQIAELSEYCVTLMLHPLLTAASHHSPRRLETRYVKKELRKLRGQAEVVECPQGVLPHMHKKEVMLSVISSSAYEWLLFDRPILFLRPHDALQFGRNIRFEKPLLPQIQAEESACCRDIRAALRTDLTSHFDGRWAERFTGLCDELEKSLC